MHLLTYLMYASSLSRVVVLLDRSRYLQHLVVVPLLYSIEVKSHIWKGPYLRSIEICYEYE